MRAHSNTRRVIFVIVLPCLIIGCTGKPLVAGQVSTVYSNVHYVEESGDVYGFELELIHDGQIAAAVLKHYQGNDQPDVEHLKGKSSGTKPLRLRGETKEGTVEVTGHEKADRFVGSVIYQVGHQSNRFELDLPLKK